MSKIDEYSRSTVPVDQFFNDMPLGSATAFVWERQGRFFLITNWHVVSGRNAETGEHLNRKTLAEPNRLRLRFHPKNWRWDTYTRDIPLRDAENRPLWLSHAEHRRAVDVVAIPLQAAEDDMKFEPVNRLDDRSLSVQIGMDVFVLGYPLATTPPYLPIWKRGSIASEPELARLGLKYFLVDTASRPGMSGAPVLLRTYGSHLTESGISLTSGAASRCIGVYSGRLRTKSFLAAQLGMVWPQSWISEIIDGNSVEPEFMTEGQPAPGGG